MCDYATFGGLFQPPFLYDFMILSIFSLLHHFFFKVTILTVLSVGSVEYVCMCVNLGLHIYACTLYAEMQLTAI